MLRIGRQLLMQETELERWYAHHRKIYDAPEGSLVMTHQDIIAAEVTMPDVECAKSTASVPAPEQSALLTDFYQLAMANAYYAHGAEAACLASRASYLAGFDATATVEAARGYGIPVAGTMAHSFVQAHPLELDAFRNFARSMPKNVTLLIDTYDIARGAERAAELAKELKARGVVVEAVRIDSGDLPAEAMKVRKILDNAGCTDTRILVSGGVDEYEIAKMRTAAAPVDAFCVGTRLSVSEDAPALDCAYKLQEYAGRPCRKHSLWKETWPGPRQVYRQYDPHGQIATDVLACADEVMEGKALLHEVMLTCPIPRRTCNRSRALQLQCQRDTLICRKRLWGAAVRGGPDVTGLQVAPFNSKCILTKWATERAPIFSMTFER